MYLLIPLYAVTLFTSAFLLFSVQPLVGKYLLPVMGGGPSVWNTAMLLFQLLLLGGYAYAHFMAHFVKPRLQFVIHMILLALAALSLPLAMPANADPTGSDPLMWQLGVMLTMAAAPFFVLSATAPLLQQWFSRTTHIKAGNPYFLYAASNLGSMLALLAYPTVIEPLLRLSNQSLTWSYGYGLLGILILVCGLLSRFSNQSQQAALPAEDDDEAITWKRRLTWLLLAFVPSSLMLGVTTYISAEVTTVPLLWVIPLALYLLTFIIAFSEKPFFTLDLTRIVQAFVALLLLMVMILSGAMKSSSVAVIHLVFFFFTALLCHQELTAIKPKARHLTGFFLIMSLGGALGGVFNSLLAPLIFKLPYEYMLVIILSLFCRYITDPAQSFASLKVAFSFNWKAHWKIAAIIALCILSAIFHIRYVMVACGITIPILLFYYFRSRWVFSALFVLVMLFNPLISWKAVNNSVAILRNYYGVIVVSDQEDVRFMTHGVTNHGGQALDPAKKFTPFSYYGYGSALADVFKTTPLNSGGKKEIAIIGLGTGCIACYYNKRDRHFEYFEIDPHVVELATNPKYFTYLSDCGVDYDIKLGDGRLMMSKEPDAKYDVIVVDAFSSDNIPLHIITKEAVALYQKKLKPDGALLFHVSNRFFRLPLELGAIAESMGQTATVKIDTAQRPEPPEGTPSTRLVDHANVYVMFTQNQKILDEVEKMDNVWQEAKPNPDTKPWSDDYANMMRALILQ